MLKPSEDVLKALAGLDRNADWLTVYEWMRESLMQQSIANNKSQGEATRIMQGRNQEIEELINYAEKARELLARARENRRSEESAKGGR